MNPLIAFTGSAEAQKPTGLFIHSDEHLTWSEHGAVDGMGRWLVPPTDDLDR